MTVPNIEEEIWKAKDGREIPVAEMNEEHVRNALRMVLRARRKQLAKLKASPSRAHMLALIIRPFLKEMDEAEQARNAEIEEAFFAQIYDDVFSDRMYGSD